MLLAPLLTSCPRRASIAGIIAPALLSSSPPPRVSVCVCVGVVGCRAGPLLSSLCLATRVTPSLYRFTCELFGAQGGGNARKILNFAFLVVFLVPFVLLCAPRSPNPKKGLATRVAGLINIRPCRISFLVFCLTGWVLTGRPARSPLVVF